MKKIKLLLIPLSGLLLVILANYQSHSTNLLQTMSESNQSKSNNYDKQNRPRRPGNSNLATDILTVHNRGRMELGIPNLTWSNNLANDAKQWAKYLASTGKFEHSPNNQRNGQGENLWMGTAEYFSYTQMAESWAAEKRYFRYGVFPNVSTTGNWIDVGHYTQMIWRKTTQIGCAIATGGGNDILVCRYSPSGNFMGEKPY